MVGAQPLGFGSRLTRRIKRLPI